MLQTTLNRDGFVDLTVANYRVEHDYNTESYVYWGTSNGFDTEQPLRLATKGPLQVIAVDLNHDDWKDLIFSGGNRVQIYWNQRGQFSKDDVKVIEVTGYSSMFSQGTVGVDVADVTGDGTNDLIIVAREGVPGPRGWGILRPSRPCCR